MFLLWFWVKSQLGGAFLLDYSTYKKGIHELDTKMENNVPDSYLYGDGPKLEINVSGCLPLRLPPHFSSPRQ